MRERSPHRPRPALARDAIPAPTRFGSDTYYIPTYELVKDPFAAFRRPADCGRWSTALCANARNPARPFSELLAAFFYSACSHALMEPTGIEPATSALQKRRSPN